MIRRVIRFIMNATQQLKRLFQIREKEEAVLEDINRKLDTILKRIERLEGINFVSDSTQKIPLKSNFPFKDLYVPNIKTDNMKVNAKAKLIGEVKENIENTLDKLNKLGGK